MNVPCAADFRLEVATHDELSVGFEIGLNIEKDKISASPQVDFAGNAI